MNAIQKDHIAKLRKSGETYSLIAATLGLSLNTVKSYCRRNNLSKGSGNESAMFMINSELCAQCGKSLIHRDKAKPKRFCDDKCRLTWWNHHRDQLTHRTECKLTCARCGTVFHNHGNMSRKYCSHFCYIAHRFGAADGGAI